MSSAPPRSLVIFGCGYLGSEVARRALARGWRVTAVTRNETKARELAARGIDAVVGELASEEWHSRVGNEPAFALNCVSSGGGGLEGYRRSYLDGARSIAAWTRGRATPLETLAYTSSTAVYANMRSGVVDETAPVGGEARADILADTEAVLHGAAAKRVCILRLAGLYGPGRHRIIDQVRTGVVSGKPEHRLNLIHRDDAAAAVLAAFDAHASVGWEIFNVADDGAATRREIVEWLAKKLNVGTPSFTEEETRRPRGSSDRVIANGKLKAQWGWRPEFATFREGYARLIEE